MTQPVEHKKHRHFNTPSPESIRILGLSELSLIERGKTSLYPASAIRTIREMFYFVEHVSLEPSRMGERAKLLVEIMTGKCNRPE